MALFPVRCVFIGKRSKLLLLLMKPLKTLQMIKMRGVRDASKVAGRVDVGGPNFFPRSILVWLAIIISHFR